MSKRACCCPGRPDCAHRACAVAAALGLAVTLALWGPDTWADSPAGVPADGLAASPYDAPVDAPANGLPGMEPATLFPASPDKPPMTGRSGAVPDLPTAAELESLRAAIGSIAINVEDIFNEADPREDLAPYRLANDLHIRTRDATVRGQLLFKPGEPFSARKAEETARILRDRNYLSDAAVEVAGYDPDANTVNLKVRVRDVWSLSPGVGFGRSGGTNKSRFRIVDENFLGLGELLALEYKSNVDRSGLGIQFKDTNFLHSWWDLRAHYANNSDGSIRYLALSRPFYSLDSRWSAGVSGTSIDQLTPLYDLGEKVNEFQTKFDLLDIQGGISRGLVNGWTTRWLAGYRYDRSLFTASTGDVPTVALPVDRTLSYPWLGVELVEDRYETTENQDQIGRTEDVFLGKRLRAELGWAASAFGADRSAGIFALSGELGRPLGKKNLWFLRGDWTGRLENGSTADALLEAATRYYHRFSERNVFVASVDAAYGHDLDLDHQLQLGGDNGLRGYPLRYQNGDLRALFTVEERYFTDWFPFRLFRVGGAMFMDYGRTWGTAPLATEPLGWLGDVGFGLRLGNVRSGLGNVLHLDLAFPVGGPGDIASPQVIIEAAHTF